MTTPTKSNQAKSTKSGTGFQRMKAKLGPKKLKLWGYKFYATRRKRIIKRPARREGRKLNWKRNNG